MVMRGRINRSVVGHAQYYLVINGKNE